MSRMQQMPLALKPPRQPSFGNFITDVDSSLIETLQSGLEEGEWYLLLGPEGSGKSHLLSALFSHQLSQGELSSYVPLGQPDRWRLLDAMEAPVIIIDDVDAIAANREGEMALFNALNRCRASRSLVVMSATSLSDFVLPDLISRLGQATRLTLRPLGDPGLEALALRLAADQELSMNSEMARYLVSRARRNAGDVTRLMNDVMAHALSERRPITVPLIRSVLMDG